MLKHLLVCLKPGSENEACQAAALELAVQTGAVLSGVFVRAPAPLERSPTPAEPDERVLEHRLEQDSLQQLVHENFMQRASAAGARAGTILRTGDVQAEILGVTQATELVMVGRGRTPDRSLLGSVTGALVRAAGRPVLVVPEWRGPLERIAVAYDGSAGADRALSAAADLAMRWKAKTPALVLVGVTGHDDVSERFLEPARRYLNACDLEYRVTTAPGDPGVLINALALTADAGLLCMGAYGHSLLREALLGSVTQRVLASWPRALILAR